MREDRPLLRATERERTVVARDLERAEDPELHPSNAIPRHGRKGSHGPERFGIGFGPMAIWLVRHGETELSGATGGY